jgi:hypothetical protein
MKFLVAISLLLLLGQADLLAQHTLELTTGEKLEGTLISFNKGRISFLFKGNSVTLSDSQVSAVYFQPTFLRKGADSGKSEFAHISGVVTYFFNENFGHRPDAGAEIFVIPTSDAQIDSTIILTYSIFRVLKTIKEMSGKPLSDSDKTVLKQVDNSAFEACWKIRSHPKTVRLVADGNGSYSIEVAPADYYVLIISQHRKDVTKTELLGKVKFTRLRTEGGKRYSVNAKFEP